MDSSLVQGFAVAANMPEKNKYVLLNFKRDADDTLRFQEVVFYKLNSDGSFENGTTLEEMLRVVSERLSDLDSQFHCEENESALNHLKEARILLDTRTQDRIARGGEGKHEA